MFPRPSSFVMASPVKVMLIACGSFNPVTNMHLRMFELARDQLNKTGRYEVIGGIMSPVSDAYEKEGLVAAKHRCAMLRLALKTSDWVSLDVWECDQKQWISTERVLHHHRKSLLSLGTDNTKPTPAKRRKNVHKDDSGNKTPKIRLDDTVQLKLLCGADLLESFAVPGLWSDEDIEEIVGSYGLVCISRSGCNPHKFIYESDVLTKFQNNIFIITEWIYNDISSTKIRRALRRQESVKYLVQDSVIEYVRKHRLYGVPDNKYINHIVPSPNAENCASPEEDSEEQTTVTSLAETSSDSHTVLVSSKLSPEEKLSTSWSDDKLVSSPTRMFSSKTSPCLSPRKSPCLSEISMLVRRVRNVRLSYTPETCV